MGWKEFFKPNLRRIVLFIIFLILTSILVTAMIGRDYNIIFLICFLAFPSVLLNSYSNPNLGLLSFIINVIYLYFLSCLISFIYENNDKQKIPDLLKPNKKKFILFIGIIAIILFLNFFVLTAGFIVSEASAVVQLLVIYFLFLINWPIHIPVAGLILDLVWLYFLSCLIVWTYDKVRKKRIK